MRNRWALPAVASVLIASALGCSTPTGPAGDKELVHQPRRETTLLRQGMTRNEVHAALDVPYSDTASFFYFPGMSEIELIRTGKLGNRVIQVHYALLPGFHRSLDEWFMRDDISFDHKFDSWWEPLINHDEEQAVWSPNGAAQP